jgi:hypothetical protein
VQRLKSGKKLNSRSAEKAQARRERAARTSKSSGRSAGGERPISTEANRSATQKRIAELSGAIKRDLGESPVEEPVARVPSELHSRSRVHLRVAAVRTAQVRFVNAMIALSEVGGSDTAEMVSRLSAALSEAAHAIQGAGIVDFVTQPAPNDDNVMKYARELLKLVLNDGHGSARRVARVVAESNHIQAFQQRWLAIYSSWRSPLPEVSPPMKTRAGLTATSSSSPSIGNETIADPGTTMDHETPPSKNQWRVLAILYAHAEHLLTVEDICGQLESDGHPLCDTTVKKFLRQFGREGLTERPGHGHSGARLTPKGRALVERRGSIPRLPPV